MSTESMNQTSGTSTQTNAAERLESLVNLDKKIAEILKAASELTNTIAEGKIPPYTEPKRQNFKDSLAYYNNLVEQVNNQLRREVQLLHEASHTSLHPLNVPIQASHFGRQKEREIFQSIWDLQDKME